MNNRPLKDKKHRKPAQQLCEEEIFSFYEEQEENAKEEIDEEMEEEDTLFYSGDHLFGVIVEMFPHKSRQSLLQAWNTHRPNLEAAVCQLLSEPDDMISVPQAIVNDIHESGASVQNDFFDEWSGLTPPEKSFRDDWSNSWDTSNPSGSASWNVEMMRNTKFSHADHSPFFPHFNSQSTFPS